MEKPKNEVTDEEINNFYTDVFRDFEKPLEVIRVSAEGTVSFSAMLFCLRGQSMIITPRNLKRACGCIITVCS